MKHLLERVTKLESYFIAYFDVTTVEEKNFRRMVVLRIKNASHSDGLWCCYTHSWAQWEWRLGQVQHLPSCPAEYQTALKIDTAAQPLLRPMKLY